MATKASIDQKIIDDITNKISVYKQESMLQIEQEQHLESYLDALSELYEVDREQVSHLAHEVISAHQGRIDYKEVLYRGFLKYNKELLGVVIIGMLVTATLYGYHWILPMERPAPVVSPLVAPAIDPQGVMPTHNRYVKMSMFAQLFATVSPVRMQILSHYTMVGEFPSTLEDMGLKRAEMSTGRYISDVMIGEKGQLFVKASRELGENAILSITPKITMGGMSMEWHCVTNVDVVDGRMCTYQEGLPSPFTSNSIDVSTSQ